MYRVWIIGLMAACQAVCGSDTSFPWEELKTLYRATITEQLRAPQPKTIITLDRAHYALQVRTSGVEGMATISGRLVTGLARPVALFGPDLILQEGVTVSGASLVPGAETGTTHVLPESGPEGFEVTAPFLVRPVDERGVFSVTISIPRALTSAVTLALEDGLRLLEAPGIPGPSGEYYLGSVASFTVRYAAATAALDAQAPEVDLFTRILVQPRRVVLETHAISVRSLAAPALLRLPPGAQFLNTSLRPTELTLREAQLLAITGMGRTEGPFVVECALPIPDGGAPLRLELPRIESNTGREGRFVVVEPDDGQVTVEGEQLVSHIPRIQLGDGFPVGNLTHFMRIPPGQPFTLAISRFGAERVMETVLPSQALVVRFDDTGRSLSTLYLDVPPEVGSRLMLTPVPGSEIWSLKVNGQSRQVYTGAGGTWIVPLADGGVSKVELAFLREGEAVGLQGRLEVEVPRTGLAAEILYVGIELPSRVELVSVEGPVNTSTHPAGGVPEVLAAMPCVLTQPFYKGEGISVAIAYKEPVNRS